MISKISFTPAQKTLTARQPQSKAPGFKGTINIKKEDIPPAVADELERDIKATFNLSGIHHISNTNTQYSLFFDPDNKRCEETCRDRLKVEHIKHEHLPDQSHKEYLEKLMAEI